MARPPGARNADFDEAREKLLRALLGALPGEQLARASLRSLAEAAGVGVATLRHYFGTREGVVSACFELVHRDGMPYLLEVAADPPRDVRASLRWLLLRQLAGLERGVGALHASGLTAGIGDGALGPSYLEHVLEPSLQAVEARLARHVARGELRPLDVRAGALQLLSPLVLAWLHQNALGGSRCRPLDLEALAAGVLDGFLRAYAVKAT